MSLGAVVSLSAVLLVFQYGQPRIFFAMGRDGLLPKWAAKVHPKTRVPHVTTLVTGIAVAVGALLADENEIYDLTNIGTLSAFAIVCIGVLALRYIEPDRPRPFRVKFVWPVTILGAAACIYTMFGLPGARGSDSVSGSSSVSCCTSRTASASRRCAAAHPQYQFRQSEPMSEPISGSGKGMKLHTKILLGLLVGAVLGISANVFLGGKSPFVEGVNHYVAGPAGQIFLRLLFMIVIPLVFASIALGVAGLGDLKRVGRVGGKAIGYFLVSTALAATLGLIVVSIVRPGERIPEATRIELMATYSTDASSKVQAAATSEFGIQTLVNIVPRNPVKAAADLDMLGIIFFGMIFGAALTMIKPEKAKPMLAVLEGLNDAVIKIVEIAMRLAPFGVAALIFGVTSRFGFDVVRLLGWYVMVVLGSLLLHVLINISAIIRFLIGMSPWKFFGRIRSALVTAFSTSSSSATLPTAIATAEENLGIPKQIAGFVLPLGSTMCMNGTALFEGITVITLAQAFGVHLGFGQMIAVMVMSVITAVGAAGVPGGSIPLMVGVLTMFGVPAEGIAIVLGVDRILDMSRTTVNVCGDLSATAWVARVEGVWNPSMIPAIEGGMEGGAKLDDSPGWPKPQV